MRLHIATPCHEDWSAMTPNGPGRHCASCDKTVLDLTALTSAQSLAALATVRTRVDGGEKLCVRGHADAQGRLRATRARRRLLTNAMAGMLAVAMAGTFAGCAADGTGGEHQPQTTQPQPVHQPRAVEPSPLMGAPAPRPPMMGAIAAPRPLMGKVAAPRPALRMGEALAMPAAAPQPVVPAAIAGGIHQAPEPEAALMGDVCMPAPAPREPTAPPTRAP